MSKYIGIGARVRTAREKIGLTRMRLGELANVRYQTITDVERGLVPSYNSLRDLAAVLQVEPGYLCWGDNLPRGTVYDRVQRILIELGQPLEWLVTATGVRRYTIGYLNMNKHAAQCARVAGALQVPIAALEDDDVCTETCLTLSAAHRAQVNARSQVSAAKLVELVQACEQAVTVFETCDGDLPKPFEAVRTSLQSVLSRVKGE